MIAMKRSNKLNAPLSLEILVHVSYWLFHFTAVNTSWELDWTNSWDRKGVAQLTIILYPFVFYFNAFWLIPKLLKGNQWYRYLTVSFVVVLGMEVIRTFAFLGHRGEWASFENAFTDEFFSKDNLLFGVPNSLAFAFIFSTIYRFTRDWIINQQLIAGLQKEKLVLINRMEELENDLKDKVYDAGELSEKLATIFDQKRMTYKKSFQARRRDETYVLKVNQITYWRAQGDFVLAYDEKGDSYIINQSISFLEESLDPVRFFRINRSEIINSEFLVKYSNHIKNRLAIHLRGTKEILYTSNNKTPDFRVWLEEFG